MIVCLDGVIICEPAPNLNLMDDTLTTATSPASTTSTSVTYANQFQSLFAKVAEQINKDRERLTAKLKELKSQRDALDEEVQQAERELDGYPRIQRLKL